MERFNRMIKEIREGKRTRFGGFAQELTPLRPNIIQTLVDLTHEDSNRLTSLEYVYISQLLCLALTHPNNKLTTLSLYANRICDEGAIVLAEAIQHPNCWLKEINITWNSIGESGFNSLIHALKCSTLEYLAFIGNRGYYVNETREKLERIMQIKQSLWYQIFVTMCSVRNIPRIGRSSPFRCLPNELVRRIAEVYPFSYYNMS